MRACVRALVHVMEIFTCFKIDINQAASEVYVSPLLESESVWDPVHLTDLHTGLSLLQKKLQGFGAACQRVGLETVLKGCPRERGLLFCLLLNTTRFKLSQLLHR